MCALLLHAGTLANYVKKIEIFNSFWSYAYWINLKFQFLPISDEDGRVDMASEV